VYGQAHLIQSIDALVDPVVQKLKLPDIDFRGFHRVCLLWFRVELL
jgi:hypothetical protein